ncbi:MAG: hypothetical protein QNJ38_09180 [Prochloraceae cyanobacterium]|nr:hypothetical protein [Prochloraceae cyanobacterium]
MAEQKEGLFARIAKQLDRDMKEGAKQEIAGLNRSANNKAQKEVPKLNGAKQAEQKQLPGTVQQAEQKQLPGTARKTTTKKTSIKSKKKTNKLVTYTGVTSDGRPAWVKAMDNTKKQQEEAVEATVDNSFAGQYLMPTPSKSRRKPGPSLNMFKDMARQVKIPANVKKG